MDNKANDTFAFDLENRLDDFFSDSLPAQEKTPTDEQKPSDDSLPLKDLKSSILSMDWEITDEGLTTFIEQIESLETQVADDKVNQKHLKILNSLGKYLRSRKSKAHPDTIKRIMSVYSALEESVTNSGLSQADREKRLKEEIIQFQQLKSQIVKPNSQASPKKVQETMQTASVDAVIKAIDDLKSTIAAEFTAIREELKRLVK